MTNTLPAPTTAQNAYSAHNYSQIPFGFSLQRCSYKCRPLWDSGVLKQLPFIQGGGVVGQRLEMGRQ